MRLIFILIGASSLLVAAQAADVGLLTDATVASYEQRARVSYLDGAQALRAGDAELLVEFLHRLPADVAVTGDELDALKNSAADRLLSQPTPLNGLRTGFEAMFNDPAQGEVWREY